MYWTLCGYQSLCTPLSITLPVFVLLPKRIARETNVISHVPMADSTIMMIIKQNHSPVPWVDLGGRANAITPCDA